jgi:hypothetical protein
MEEVPMTKEEMDADAAARRAQSREFFAKHPEASERLTRECVEWTRANYPEILDAWEKRHGRPADDLITMSTAEFLALRGPP